MATAELIQVHSWYGLVAVFITLFTQLVRKRNVPLFTWAWKKMPDGWRFMWPLLSGAATGFADGVLSSGSLKAGLLQAGVGLLGIGGGSMGLASALKESPLKWDGGAGGKALSAETPE